MPVAGDTVRAWGSASEADLIIAQILAVDAWFRASPHYLAPPGRDSREHKMERARQREVLEAVRDAIRERAIRALEADTTPHPTRVAPRVVVAHRNRWFAEKLSATLADYGVKMVAHLANGAQAVGVTISDQPDLLVIEETLALMTGREVLQQTSIYAPRTLVVVQVENRDRAAAIEQAGAVLAFPRAMPPADVAGDLAALVEAHRQAEYHRPQPPRQAGPVDRAPQISSQTLPNTCA